MNKENLNKVWTLSECKEFDSASFIDFMQTNKVYKFIIENDSKITIYNNGFMMQKHNYSYKSSKIRFNDLYINKDIPLFVSVNNKYKRLR